MSDYEPGTLWLVEAGCWANRKVALRLGEGWAHVNGVNVDGDGVVSPVRPLVVLDPDDVEQMDVLCKALVEAAYAHGNKPVAHNGIHPDTLVDALRSLSRPPKPPEPQGLGAVVEDRDGTLWTRFTREYDYDAVWSHETSHRGNTAYADIDAVRVLFGGVRP